MTIFICFTYRKKCYLFIKENHWGWIDGFKHYRKKNVQASYTITERKGNKENTDSNENEKFTFINNIKWQVKYIWLNMINVLIWKDTDWTEIKNNDTNFDQNMLTQHLKLKFTWEICASVHV